VPDPPRFYLDANVYLAWLRGEEGRVETARELLTAGESRRLTIVASTLLYAEVCGHGEVRSATAEDVDAKIRTFFEHGFLRWVEIDLPTRPDPLPCLRIARRRRHSLGVSNQGQSRALYDVGLERLPYRAGHRWVDGPGARGLWPRHTSGLVPVAW
jgi:predicted nucleic acid-binding protein